MTKNWDVVIIGGGLAGYVAANFLAKNDLSILLLEKGKQVGGRAITNKIKDQYFNLGPHALYNKGKAKAILEELNIKLNGQSPQLNKITIEDEFKQLYSLSPLSFTTTKILNWKERIELITAMMKIFSIDTEKLSEQSFEDWVKQTVHIPKVESFIYALGRLATYCHAPERISAKCLISHIKNAMSGVLYLDGGWQTLMDQLHNNAIVSGVQVRSHTTVKQIHPIDPIGCKLILTNEEEVYGKHIISTTGPYELMNMLENDIKQNSFLSNIIPVTGSTLDVALTQLPNPNHLFALSISDPYYYSVHSHYARLSRNGDSVVLHVLKYHRPNEIIDSQEVKEELEQFLDRLQPGWQKYEITSRFIPKITVNQRLPIMGDDFELHRSKSIIPGLYIAGDWASTNAILADGAVSSGKQAAEEIIDNERRRNSADYQSRLQTI